MKFKNYRNPYTNDNRIYSFKDLYNMPFGEVIRNKQEVLGQYRVLGVPTEQELQGSENVVWVEAYKRDDGTEVRGHWRSKPNGGGVNDRVNNETSTGGAASVSNKQDTKVNEQEQTPVLEKEEKLYPKEIAGVKRGEPKTFEEMAKQGVNPNYGSPDDTEGNYSNNCQSCTVAAELVIRGYDVEAGSYSTPEAKELGTTAKSAYLNPETGEECLPDVIYAETGDECYNYLEENVKQGERHEFTYNTPTESGNKEYDKEHEYDGHVVIITRNGNNELEYYDPQNGELAKGKGVKDILEPWFQYQEPVAPPRILRIDNKAFNPKYVNAVVRKRKNR